jgi:hypothetical protein
MYLTFLSIFFSLTMANPCPCESIDNETPALSPTDTSSTNQLSDDDILEEYLNQLAANIPLLHQTNSLSTERKRFKRPSWATVGKRSSMLIKKRPSWAHIG